MKEINVKHFKNTVVTSQNFLFTECVSMICLVKLHLSVSNFYLCWFYKLYCKGRWTWLRFQWLWYQIRHANNINTFVQVLIKYDSLAIDWFMFWIFLVEKKDNLEKKIFVTSSSNILSQELNLIYFVLFRWLYKSPSLSERGVREAGWWCV